MGNILIIEDDFDTQQLLTTCLSSSHSLSFSTTLNQSIELVQEKKYDLVIVDLNLPEGPSKGYEIFSHIQSSYLNEKTPIIILSARESTPDVVHGFHLGAEDYIKKPFSMDELKARVNSKIDKNKSQNALYIDQLFIDLHYQKAYLLEKDHKRDINLTPIEFKILYSLIRQKGRAMTRQELTSKVWNDDYSFESRGIDAHISNLRKKLETYSKCIASVYGVGYSFQNLKTAAA